jgi:hypothetical protein
MLTDKNANFALLLVIVAFIVLALLSIPSPQHREKPTVHPPCTLQC